MQKQQVLQGGFGSGVQEWQKWQQLEEQRWFTKIKTPSNEFNFQFTIFNFQSIFNA